MAAFTEELAARLPSADRDRAQALDDSVTSGTGGETEAVENLRLLWPGYFADPAAAPEMPAIRMSLAAYAGTMESVMQELPRLEAALPTIGVPVGVLVGEGSPIPMDQAGLLTADRIPGAWAEVLPNAGHFPWIEVPGSLQPRWTDSWLELAPQRPYRGRIRNSWLAHWDATVSRLGGRGTALSVSRKVGTPQGRVLANGQSGRPAGKCHREQTADGPAGRPDGTGKGETVR